MAENTKQTGGAMATPQTGQNVADLATPTEPKEPAAGTAVNTGGTDDVQSKIDEALKAARKKWDAELETRLSEAISESLNLKRVNHLWTKGFRLNSLHFWRRTTPKPQRRI